MPHPIKQALDVIDRIMELSQNISENEFARFVDFW
jgi:hypothetical protein